MHKIKILSTVISGLFIALIVFGWLVQAGRATAAVEAPTVIIIYVDADAQGGNVGSSWANAYTDLQRALSAARAGDEIWVAEGLYTPGRNQANSFKMKSAVAVYGGFNATETVREQRDWRSNITVLSGDIDKNDITDINGVVTTTANITGTNAYHVVYATELDEAFIIDGFIITAGQANIDIATNDQGGGMWSYRANPILRNVSFIGNYAHLGGGIYSFSSSPTFVNVNFTGNFAQDSGGGL